MLALFPSKRLLRDGSKSLYRFSDSFMVAKSGATVSEQYFKTMAPDSHHLQNSVIKYFVGLLAGVAVQSGE
jgi:hypothetical protein